MLHVLFWVLKLVRSLWRPRDKHMAVLDQKNIKPDPYPDPDSLQMLDPDPQRCILGLCRTCNLRTSVADPDLHVFGPPGSGSTSQRYGSGSGSGSGSISQRHGSADPDPDPPQNVMDSQHCFVHCAQFPCSATMVWKLINWNLVQIWSGRQSETYLGMQSESISV